MKEVTLQSGKVLRISPAPFPDAKKLYHAILKEMKDLNFDRDYSNKMNMMKDVMCSLLSSDKVEAPLLECMKRCIYNGHKITLETFEDVGAREDYTEICVEVAMENVAPFTKSLYVLLEKGLSMGILSQDQP